MRTLIIKNTASEGPGTIAGYLQDAGMPFDVVEPEAISALGGLDNYDALVMLGGPMAVYEMNAHPHITSSLHLIEKALRHKLRVFGVCLGAQLVAHALGARVYKGNIQEIGWMDVELTTQGGSDPVLGPLAGSNGPIVKVFQWHGDTFDLPAGATLLASSPEFSHQAFRMDDNVYALQFHIEVNNDIVAGWAKTDPAINNTPLEGEAHNQYLRRARTAYAHFFGTA